MTRIAVGLLFAASIARGDAIEIIGSAPDGIESLETQIDSHDGTPVNNGPHGLEEYCYKQDAFVVYGKNLLGYGYQLSKDKPKGLECSKSSRDISNKNKLGLFVGLAKNEVADLLDFEHLDDKQTIIWTKETYHNGTRFDLQTYAEFLFEENRLVWLSVFITETT